MVMHIRANLGVLDSYIVKIRCNITKFNAYVKDLINSLTARGETMQDLLANLFKAYKAVTDCEFVTYIHKKEENFEEGVNIDTDTLMLQADNKFKTMFQAKTWNAPSPKEERSLLWKPKCKNYKRRRRPSNKREARKAMAKRIPKRRKRKRKMRNG